jgi:type I restriction enzyme, S subunit
MSVGTFLENFDLLAGAPGALPRMREMVLQLAVRGALVDQRPADLSAAECIRNAAKPLVAFAPDDTVEPRPGWTVVPLGCVIASNIGGGTPSKQNPRYWNGPIPWASVKDIRDDKYLTSTIDSITEEGLKNSNATLIPPNRLIVVTRMGLGKLAINRIPIAVNQDLRAIQPTAALDLEFAYLLLKSSKLIGTGMTVKGITVEKLHSIRIALPPVSEQKRIVAKMDRLMAVCDRLQAQQHERQDRHAALTSASFARFVEAPTLANLEYMFHPAYNVEPQKLRDAVLALALQGKLVSQCLHDSPVQISSRQSRIGDGADVGRSEVPRGWAVAPLADVAEQIVDCPHSTPKWTTSGEVCVRTNQFRAGYLDLSESKFVSKETFEERTRRLQPQADDILYSREGGILGIACRVPPDVKLCLGQRMMLIRVGTALVPAYLELVLNSPLINEIARRKTTGGAAPRINVSTVTAYPIPVPPMAEQRRIVQRVGQIMSLLDALETVLGDAESTAVRLMQAVVADTIQECDLT